MTAACSSRDVCMHGHLTCQTPLLASTQVIRVLLFSREKKEKQKKEKEAVDRPHTPQNHSI